MKEQIFKIIHISSTADFGKGGGGGGGGPRLRQRTHWQKIDRFPDNRVQPNEMSPPPCTR